ncbi:hypothetical protein DL93DRAFT_2088963 [Clavulina sp. PMI_390]|nr:hypothetical protein DL93DRAFT_2088963 [Clavulina sp. PMI_390]
MSDDSYAMTGTTRVPHRTHTTFDTLNNFPSELPLPLHNEHDSQSDAQSFVTALTNEAHSAQEAVDSYRVPEHDHYVLPSPHTDPEDGHPSGSVFTGHGRATRRLVYAADPIDPEAQRLTAHLQPLRNRFPPASPASSNPLAPPSPNVDVAPHGIEPHAPEIHRPSFRQRMRTRLRNIEWFKTVSAAGSIAAIISAVVALARL